MVQMIIACFVLLLTVTGYANTQMPQKNQQISQQQLQNLQMMQAQQQQLQIRGDLNTKIETKKSLQTELKDIDASLNLTKAFFLKYKTAKLTKEKIRVENDLRNIDIEINELKKIKQDIPKNN